MLGGGGFGGGFLNMGTPELIVIGAVAWAVLGPKELFRLSKEAGKFLGEWQQLGMNAKNTFTSALENELKEDEAAKEPAPPEPPAASEAKPPYEDWAQEAREYAAATTGFKGGAELGEPGDSGSGGSSADGGANPFTPEQEAAVRESLYAELGEPGENAVNFQDQISGARNAAVMAEYPDELTAEDVPQDGSELDVTDADEQLLATKIAERQNEIAMMQAEQEVLALKRKQLEANAARAKKMAEERQASADAAAEPAVESVKGASDAAA